MSQLFRWRKRLCERIAPDAPAFLPVMVDAANVTRGHNAAATSATARHNLFPVTRMLGSFVNLTHWSSPDAPPVI